MIDFTVEKLKEIVKNSITYADVCRGLDLLAQGANYRTVKKLIKTNNIDISHFMGLSHNKGKKRPNIKRRLLSECLVVNSIACSSHIKSRLIKEKLIDYKCVGCDIIDWKNSPLTLQLDHINGINDDHRLENLRLLCPNCHSQTSNYCGKNAKHKDSKRNLYNKCQSCDKNIWQYAIHCKKCAAKLNPKCSKNHAEKIAWPSSDELIIMTKTMSFVAAGKKLGVSDNAIRKRLKKFPPTTQ